MIQMRVILPFLLIALLQMSIWAEITVLNSTQNSITFQGLEKEGEILAISDLSLSFQQAAQLADTTSAPKGAAICFKVREDHIKLGRLEGRIDNGTAAPYYFAFRPTGQNYWEPILNKKGEPHSVIVGGTHYGTRGYGRIINSKEALIGVNVENGENRTLRLYCIRITSSYVTCYS